MTNSNCNSSNLIYCITCKRCKLQYIGQSKQSIRGRFTGHFYSITSDRSDVAVGKHFNSNGHQKKDDISISVLEFIKEPPQARCSIGIRLRVESNWIHTMRTLSPHGLNREAPKAYTAYCKE